jgi:DNA repair exonuclease SbcCD ATPase subunit
MPKPEGEDWTQWSKHILTELVRLNDNYEGIRTEISEVHKEIVNLKAGQSTVDDLKEWKKNLDEVCSPTQLKELKKEVEDLKAFKTKATTVFLVIQLIFGAIIALASLA